MVNNLGNLEAFRKFTAVRTDLPENEVSNTNNTPLAGTQMFIQGSAYKFRDNIETGNPDANYVRFPGAKNV